MKYCGKTNADHVSLFQFPDKAKDQCVFDQWVKYVEVTGILAAGQEVLAMCIFVVTISHLTKIMRTLHNYNMVIKQ